MALIPLGKDEFRLSGNFGQKLISKLMEKKVADMSGSCKMLFSVDDSIIVWKSDDRLSPLDYDDVSGSKIISNWFNSYIEGKASLVEDPSVRMRFENILNSPLSRGSKYHMLNVELLTGCIINGKHPLIFDFLYELMREKEFYIKNENYEFYLFSIYDAPDKDVACRIFDEINENLLTQYDDYGRIVRKKPYQEREVPNFIYAQLGDEGIETVNNHLSLIKIDSEN